MLIVIGAVSPTAKTTTVTSPTPPAAAVASPAAPSVRCGSDTHQKTGVCLANAPRTRTVTVTVTTAAPSAAVAPTSSAPAQAAIEDVGSSSHATDAEFCAMNVCIGNFTGEGGTIVQCADGTYSHAGGISGACSRHGGEQ
ncbi:MAG: hypothetical protein QOE44_3249 [Solirubrobacteraceae bacterium]|nr:hypothetical protein [Solirubrobacteraceae bacterium]